jgi:uncharacterized damage-inducible protein DinB
MTLAETYLAEFEQESETTRRFLERIPGDKLAWKPHEKSMTAGQLAMHIATAPGGVVQMALADRFAMPDLQRTNPQPASVEEVLAALDESIATVRRVLSTITDAQMQETWRLMQGDAEVLAMPRSAVLRSILLNHWYHHRGQLGVYLRLLGAKVPSSYGPSGDELPAFLNKPPA